MPPKNDESKPKRGFNRRTFIKSAAAGTGAVALAGALGRRADVYADDYPDIPENKVLLPPNGKSVLILGGGFGGLHAACELVDRGFKVTIIEKTNILGGKLKSWRDPNFGVPPANTANWPGYPRDHGAHAVWGFYNNLREFMGRRGFNLWKFPRSSTMYNFLDKDGTSIIFGDKTDYPWPLNKLILARQAQAGFLKLAGEDPQMMKSAMLKVAAFDFDDYKQRMYLDSLTMPEWGRSVGMPDSLIYKFFGPLSEMAMFDHIDNTSALYTLMLSALVIGHPDDLDIDIFMHPPGETYIAPLTKYLESRGATIIYNTPVVKLNRAGNAVVSVTAGDENGTTVSGVPAWKCNICGSVFNSPTKPARCPVCGAPGTQIIPYSSGPSKEYVADYYIVAMDTPGAKNLIQKSNFLGDQYFDKIMKLDKTDVYPVNLWYSNCDSWKKRFPAHMDFFPSGFKFLGITLNWADDGTINGKQVTPPLVPDYQGKNITVIETQIANTDLVANFDDEQIAKLVHEELKIVIPDLPTPTDYYVNRWTTYSPQRVGYEALRPSIQSPIDNLFMIGDWVRTDHLSVYMEKTNVSSKMVTNLLIDKIGQKEGKIRILRSGTPSLTSSIVKTLVDVYP